MAPMKVGRYEIQEEIGRGGMAVVYRAVDPRFGREVAVKLMTKDLLEDFQLKVRFEREARTIASLEHPAIVPVYDSGEDQQRPYLVMRLMSGGTLADRLAQGPMSISETVNILRRVGSALERAHEKGIVHRDLKPSNIMFDDYGDAFLADFGIARLTESTVTLTGEAVIGTPAYMSPEQIHGDKEIDGRSDIYALGVICFEMLTGQRPYDDKTPAKVMMRHLMDPVPDIREARPDLPPGIETAISRSMAKQPDDRYDTAGQLTDTLEGVAAVKAVRPISGEASKVQAATPVKSDTYEAETVLETDGAEVTISEAEEGVRQIGDSPQLEQKSGRRTWVVAGVAAVVVVLILGAAILVGGGILLANRLASPEAVVEEPQEVVESAPTARPTTTPQPAEDLELSPEPALLPQAEAELETFYQRLDVEDYDGALEAINKAIELVPDNAWYYHERGYWHWLVGDLEAALEDTNRALELEPENTDFFARRAAIAIDAEDHDLALESLSQALRLDPGDPYLHADLGQAFASIGDLEAAVAEYNAAIESEPDEGWFYGLRASAYREMGDVGAAVEDLNTAIDLLPNEPGYYAELADIYLWEFSDPQTAIDLFDQAINLETDAAWLYTARAVAQREMGDIDGALASHNRAIELDPSDGWFYLERATTYRDYLDDLDAALADYNLAIETDPENPDLFQERSNFYREYLGDLGAALADLDHAIELAPEEANKYNDRAILHRELGDDAAAITDWEQCLELDSEFYWCYFDRAWFYDERGETEAAVADFEAFLETVYEDDCPECQQEAVDYIREFGGS
jgi:tetratricopeptide (TPR) repeat protein